MKMIFLPALIAMLTIANTACNNGGSKKDMAKDSEMVVANTVVPMEVLQNTVVEVTEKPSDEHFRAALIAFDKKEQRECAKHIREGIKSFKKETAADKGKRKRMAEAAMKKLDRLDVKVEKGEVKNVEVLKHAFQKAEKVNIHQTLVMVNDLFIPEKQDDIKSDFSKILARLKNTVAEEKGIIKAEGEKVVKDGNAMETKLNTRAKVTKDDMENFIIEGSAWLETHS